MKKQIYIEKCFCQKCKILVGHSWTTNGPFNSPTPIGNWGQFVGVGFADGIRLGSSEGASLGIIEGPELRLGRLLGLFVGDIDSEGESLGTTDGPELRLGILLGLELGEIEFEGATLPVMDGFALK
eukprot:scaffold40091_cov54-Attheya_sp.AAC.8